MTYFLLILLLLFTIGSGFFSMSQISLFSLSSGEIKLYRQQKDPHKQRVASLLARPRALLVTLMFCDVGMNLLIQNTAANLFGSYTTWLLKVGVPLLITLLLGEMIPKTLGLSYNTKIAASVAPVIGTIQTFLGPLRYIITAITSVVSRFFFFFLKTEPEISTEELKTVLKSSETYGILNNAEGKLIQGYLSLSACTVKERMHPREEIFYYSLEDDLSKLAHLFVDKRCSRLPICEGDLQGVVGILSATDFFAQRSKIHQSSDLLPHLVKPYYVPETISARTLLRNFFQTGEEMGIVVDEYGAVSGLITHEDLYEVVIGEIADPRDEKIRYTPAGRNVIITSGKFELREFEALFHTSLPTANNMVTVGGWLTEQLGDIPKSGTKFTWNDFLFQVLAADQTCIRRIYIRRLTHAQ